MLFTLRLVNAVNRLYTIVNPKSHQKVTIFMNFFKTHQNLRNKFTERCLSEHSAQHSIKYLPIFPIFMKLFPKMSDTDSMKWVKMQDHL